MTDDNSIRHTLLRSALFKQTYLGAFLSLLIFAVIFISSCRTGPDAASDSDPDKDAQAIQADLFTLLDGETLGQWQITDFTDHGDVVVKDGAIHLPKGNDMTGVTWTGPVVRMNYELTLEAMRVEGSDFFCALTFPVDSNSCSLVLGGWGGTLCGISNLDYYDAANNETTSAIDFENGKWYHVRVLVVPGKMQAWVDGEEIVNVETAGRRIDTRFEVDMCKPLGLASWQTYGAIRNIWVRKVPPQPEITL